MAGSPAHDTRSYPRITVCVDMDGVACDFIRGFKLAFPHLDFPSETGDASRPWGWNLGTVKSLIAQVPRGFWAGLPAMENFATTIKGWLTDGVNVIFATARGANQLTDDIVRETRYWLDFHCGDLWVQRYEDPLDPCSIVFTDHKHTVDADVWIEDLPYQISALREADKPVVVVAHDYNETEENRHDTWDDIANTIHQWRVFSPFKPSAFRLRQSSLKVWRNCPHKYVTQYYSGEEGDVGDPAHIGSFVHAVIERLLMNRPDHRTVEDARSIARSLPLPPVTDIPDFKVRVWDSVLRYFHLTNPSEVRVRALERTFETDIQGVPVTGTIDIIYEDGSIADIKTGSASKWAHEDNQHQIRLYTLAMTALGEPPPTASIIYLNKHPHIAPVSISPISLANVRDALVKDHPDLITHLKAREAPTSPNALCGWCHLLSDCADGQAHCQSLARRGRLKDTAPAHDIIGLATHATTQ